VESEGSSLTKIITMKKHGLGFASSRQVLQEEIIIME
jgi:hypothetical protein